MYLDTKNFGVNASTQNSTTTTETHKNSEDKFKLKKVWKPFVRLMSKSGKKTASAHLPNNVNLNNSANVISAKKDLYFGEGEEQQQQQNEQCTEIMHKLTAEECWKRLTVPLVEKNQEDMGEPQQFIKSASVEKTPVNTCNSTCVYGRNCQHAQYHKQTNELELLNLQCNPSAHHLPSDSTPTLNYVGAEDGCFVWSESMEDFDTIMLREWLMQNSWQYAKNATMC